jgi:two-component system, OmpR family, sensor histidine kinase CreC
MVTIRTRIIIGFLLIAAVGFYYLVNWAIKDLRPHYMKSMEESLVDESVLLASFVEGMLSKGSIAVDDLRTAFNRAQTREVRATIYDMVKTRMNIRMYITDAKGIVVFDSDNGIDEGKDYSRWIDVRRTLRGKYGARTTHTIPGDQSTSALYVAAPLRADTAIVGVLTVCKPTGSVTFFIDKAQKKIITAGLIAALGVFILGASLSIWVTLPLRRLTVYAREVRDGKPSRLQRLGIFSRFGHSEMGVMGRALEEMRDALEGKKYIENYVQTLTHEIKSPISAIRGAAELIDDTMPPDKREHFLNNIRVEVERIQNIVDRLLELSALESRKNLREITDIDLGALVKDLLKSMVPVFDAKNLVCSSSVPDGIVIKGERFLVRQALANCLQNAVDFTPPAGTISVTLEKSSADVVVTIDDTGVGIPEYALDKIFERFYSLNRPDTKRKSTGLGLSFVREALALHQGKVTVTNRKEGGVRAEMRFPAGVP